MQDDAPWPEPDFYDSPWGCAWRWSPCLQQKRSADLASESEIGAVHKDSR